MSHPDRCPYCGSISEGTLRPEDLIPAFAEALIVRLEELEQEQHVRNRSSGELRRAIADLEEVELRMAAPGYYESEDPDEDLQWLEELLEHYAPPGHWFGAHPGDGAAFGFWPLDLLEEGDVGGAAGGDPRPAASGRADIEAAAPSRATSSSPSPLPEYGDTHVETWFERDRAHVALYDSRTQSLLVEWWDDDVAQAVEDGFLDRRDYHRSAYDYARHLAGAGDAE
jgi:hypothetical protein